MGRREFFEEKKLKRLVYVFSVTLVMSIIIFLTIFVMYNKKLKEQSSQSLIDLAKMNDIVDNSELKEASYSSDSTVQDANNVNKTSNTNTSNTTSNSTKNVVSKTPVASTVQNTNKKEMNSVDNTNSTNTTNEISANNVTVEENKELNFKAPVSGDIIKDFAMDTLVYSNTLEEWTTHSGIDIKADKTTIVVASEEGTIESIKNDPRYGLTVTISHANGFKTVYSNLLTTEFISENETVEKGQTIGTVGETSSFEVADESHLHFEMYKDNQVVNPTIYLK